MKGIRLLTAAGLLLAGSAFAQQDIQLIGKIQQQLPRSANPMLRTLNAQALPTSITLLKIELSDNAWMKLQARTEETEKKMPQNPIVGESKGVQLGMNDVPVLDQGPHSTCATFAVTAAIDAALHQGDTISQLCQLQLGRHLEKNGYTFSGWNGSMGPIILHQMQTFGFVSKATQREKGCAGTTEYPTYTSDEPEAELSLADYHALSEAMPEGSVSWSSMLDAYHVFVDKVDPNQTLKNVITALNAGDRLTFGVLLFSTEQGIAGAIGKHHASNDTWVLTPEIIKQINEQGEFGGHAMIITGYDNEAVAIDNQGRSHKGLLTIRNSWGSHIGNNGDFYMSYDYFKALTIEIQRIRSS